MVCSTPWLFDAVRGRASSGGQRQSLTILGELGSTYHSEGVAANGGSESTCMNHSFV